MAFEKTPRGKGPRKDDKRGRAGPKGKAGGKTSDPKTSAGERPKTVVAADGPIVPGEGERISKRLSRAGVASRRDVERMIMAGRVALNGKVLESPAVNVGDRDVITVDGEEVGAIERTRLWLYYKPAGLVTTNKDPEGRTTIFEKMPAHLPRVVTIGRLDINTEGLLLLTNDGGLARVLELPTTGWLRRYRVRAHGRIDQARLDELKEGIAVDGVLYGAIDATLDREQGSNVWITMGLREGKNREVKNVLGALGLDVNRLIRLSYGPFQLADLAEGEVREVRGRTLRDQLGERLIGEAGANFEAPVIHQANPSEAKPGEKPAGPQRGPREKPADRDERLRGRLDTKPAERGARDRKGGDEKPARKPFSAQRRRASNVWIADGARPLGPKRTAEKAAAAERQAAKDEKQRRTRSDKPDGSKAPASRSKRPMSSDRPAGPKPDRSAPKTASKRFAGPGKGPAKGEKAGPPGTDAKAKQSRRDNGRPSGGHGRADRRR